MAEENDTEKPSREASQKAKPKRQKSYIVCARLDCPETITHYEGSCPTCTARQEADPYAELKAAHAAGKVIQYTDDNTYKGKWQDCPRPQWVKESEHNINPRYRVKPETFEAHGKMWTRHNPGNPMPCDGETKIEVVFQDGAFSGLPTAASIWEWSKEHPQNEWIVGWRYADQPSGPAALDTQKPSERCLHPVCSAWVTPKQATPEEGEWVLHTYAGVRAPEYGMYARGRFWRNDGPESFPTTHWLRIPPIDQPNNPEQPQH